MTKSTTHNTNQRPIMYSQIDWFEGMDDAPKDGTWIAVHSIGGIPDVARFNSEYDAWETIEHVGLGEITYDSWDLNRWAHLSPITPKEGDQVIGLPSTFDNKENE